MKNIDKIKISLGQYLFDYICGLSTEALKSMKQDIDNDIEKMFHSYSYQLQQKRLDEQWLINYRLTILKPLYYENTQPS